MVNQYQFNNIPSGAELQSVASLYSSSNAVYAHRLPTFPENISDGFTANWQTQDILGRTSPMAAYSSTGFRTVSFDLQLHRELVFDNTNYNNYVRGKSQATKNSNYSHILEIEEILTALKLACYPLYANNGLVSPTIYFRFGQWTCKGFLESISYNWKPPIIDDKFMLCDVSIGPIQCSPKSVLAGSANYLMKNRSMNPFGNSDDRGETSLVQQGGTQTLH